MAEDHIDEGTIHTWIDGALGAADAARVAAHVAACPHCSAAAAEARGLVAGAARIVRALDPDTHSVRAGQAAPTPWGTPPVAARPVDGSLWRALRVTPARAAIAATLIVAVALTFTHDWVARDSAVEFAVADSTLPAEAAALSASPASGAPRDALLDSAIARNIAQAVPPRTLERAPGMDIPTPPAAPPSATALPDPMAPVRLVRARRAEQALRDTGTIAADRVAAAPAPATAEVAAVAAGRIANQSRAVVGSATAATGAASANTARECLRIESPLAGARWGGAELPLVVALSGGGAPAGGVARVTPSGSLAEEVQVAWRRGGSDSLRLELRRAGYAGTIELAGAGAEQAGTMRSSETAMTLSVTARRIACP